MKMIQGTGTISNYVNYTNNCTQKQMPYKIPVPTLRDVQLYIDIGDVKPNAVQYELIHTCGSLGGTVETLTTSSYVIGQDTLDRWYGVFKNFDPIGNPLNCFVIAITLDFGSYSWIFFSDEYCIENNCGIDLVLLKGCYGLINNKLAHDCQGVYFGTHAGEPSVSVGDKTIVYRHQFYIREMELTLTSIKNSFKQGRTRNFRTEKEKIYTFLAELVPEWYIIEIDALFYRGEVFIGSTKYLVNETQFEKVEDCKRMWKPTVTLKDSCYLSFTCESDPCAEIELPPCCDPLGVTAIVEVNPCCDPEVTGAIVESFAGCKLWRNDTAGTLVLSYVDCVSETFIDASFAPTDSLCATMFINGDYALLTLIGDCL